MRVLDAMTTGAVTVGSSMPIRLAHSIMEKNRIHHLVVTEGRHLLGILSERDILLCSSHENGNVKIPDLAVGEIMKDEIFTCTEEDSLEMVTAAMLRMRISCVPVVNIQRDLVGVVTRSDLLRFFSQSWRHSVIERSDAVATYAP